MPFTVEQFLDVFKNYNQTVFPLQIVFNLLAAASIIFIITKKTYADKFCNTTLTFLWLWSGVVYHICFFTVINKTAYAFGGLFIIQSFVFFFFGVIKKELSFSITKGFNSILAAVFLIYALIIYPVLGSISGHSYPYQPTFGLPCPTTIFTFGLLLLSVKKLKWYIYLIPLIWALIGSTAALKFGIYEDTGLLITGIVSSIILFTEKRKK